MTPRFKLSWSLCFALSLGLDCWAFEEGSPSNRESLWQEFMNQGKQHREQRRFADAEKDYRAAVSAAQQFGSEDPRHAASLNGLATTYHQQGRYSDAEICYRKALSLWEAALEPQSENVAICLNNLATLLQDRGQFAEAEPMLKRALAIQEKLLGAGQSRTSQELGLSGRSVFSSGFVCASRNYLSANLWQSERRPSSQTTLSWPSVSTTSHSCSFGSVSMRKPKHSIARHCSFENSRW